ncbi:SLAP domain-containing protein [Companilactobacillus versmoldensis]|uniref:S-layer protein C-terminal domain-containing protein n=1 Tax=Companilactobacillus versmoldensis DSM 14857 = KCTC 3814 TaxID=1423815 RepID=A0A0R1SI41_9LACO|nr:SLAP domain-containing protein [Companilactobacillus versmoldensis]KRL68473.1 hypothetical protein FC27_GL000171 [Companilactobacillus versmoldensis DSM 14857 = KCTC 3814]
MKNKTSKFLMASAVAIMMAPAALSALPQQTASADTVGTLSIYTPIYSSTGNANGKTLPNGSSWILGEKITLNGVTNYQVGSDEYVPAFALTNITNRDDDNSNADTNTDTNNDTDTTTENGVTDGNEYNGQVGTVNIDKVSVVDSNGQNTGNSLSNGSQWIIGNKVLTYNNAKYYPVSTDGYVLASSLDIATPNIDPNSSIPTPGNGLIGTTNKQLRTYNSDTNSYDMTLPANTSWKISKLVVNKYGSFWGEVATNQYVWITDVTLNSGLNLNNNSYYIPNFATSINK